MDMKANRKFVEEKEAVSAVIGVILMVAITVAIAATVYYYVTTLAPTEGGSSPALSWSSDAANNRIIITKCNPSDAYYSSGSSANLLFKQGTNIYWVGTGFILADETGGGELSDSIDAGDIITGFNSNTKYTVVWNSTNEVIGSFTL
jgi:flagellin-like protein